MMRVLILSSNMVHRKLMVGFVKKAFLKSYIDEADGCDDALSKIPTSYSSSYDVYFFDQEHCHYFREILERTKDFNKKRILLGNLSDSEPGLIVRINITEGNQSYFLIDNKVILERAIGDNGDGHDKYIDLLNFIVKPPIFYFSYGNNKGKYDISDRSKDILLNVEKCINKIFPHFETRKDFENFRKGWFHDEFKQDLADSDYIIIILSDEFFESYYCMEELYLILRSVNFDFRKFNDKVIFIYANDINKKINPRNVKDHRDFSKKLKNYWIEKFSEYCDAYKDSQSSSYQEQVELTMNILTNVIPLINDKFHTILQGEIKTVDSMKNDGYPSLIIEINDKLESKGFHTFYTGIPNKDEKIMNDVRKSLSHEG